MLLLCALIVGSGSAWAAEYTHTFASGQVTSSAEQTVTLSSKSWKIVQSGSTGSANYYLGYNSGLQIGSKNTNSLKTVLSTEGISGTITKVVLNDKTGSKGSGTVEVKVGGTSYGSKDLTVNSYNDDIFTGSSTGKIELIYSQTAAVALYLSKITITYEERPDAPTFSVAGGEFSKAFDLTITGVTGTTLKYTTDGTDPTEATATASNTAVVNIPAATTKVRAIALKGGVASAEASATYTYVDNSKTVPTFTIPASIDLKVGEEGKSITVTTNSDGKVSFTSSDEENLDVTDEGVLYAIAAGEYTVRVDVAETATYNAATGTVTVNVTKNDTGIAYSDTEANATLGQAFTAPTLTNALNLDVDYASSNTSVATIDNDGNVTLIGGGTTVISATFTETDEYNGTVASYTLTVTDPTLLTATFDIDNDYATLFPELAGTSSSSSSDGDITSDMTATVNGVGVTVSAKTSGTENRIWSGSPRLRMYSGTLTVTAPVNHVITAVNFTNHATNFNVTESGNAVSANSGAAAWAGTPANSVVFTISSNTQIKTIVVSYKKTAEDVTITSAEYATYCSTSNLDFSSTGITVYTATDKETSVALNEITSGKVPANTPVVLYKAGADGSAINVPVIDSADTPEGTNDLHVSTGTDVANMYVLSKKTGVVGFYKWQGASNLSAGKIYLQAKGSYAPEFLGFSEENADDNTTEVSEKVKANSSEASATVYNLNGQRVSQPTKGLYIVNGKKVILK